MKKANEPEADETGIGVWVITLAVMVFVFGFLWVTELGGLLLGLFR